MKSRRFIFIIGLILFFTPALGLPSAWKDIMLVAFGVVLCAITVTDFGRNRNKLAGNDKASNGGVYKQNEIQYPEDKNS